MDVKVGLVTGGSRGIGAAVVEQLARAGAVVAGLDREPSPRSDADGPDGPAGGGAKLFVPCDVTDEATVVAAVERVRAELGPIDAAVLCAGIGGSSPITKMPVAEWDRVHAVNSRGVFLTLRQVARTMVADRRPGSIVVITSVSARTAERTMAHYSASKAAAEALVRVAARELGPRGVRVNAVAPGTTDTPLFSATDAVPGYRQRVASRAALGRVGTAEEVALAVMAVLTSPWITGQTVVADGGLSLWSPLDPTEAP